MTGYAQARIIENGWSLRISIRSVNHRFLDLHLRVPEGFEPLEPRIRQIVRERVRRGHLDVTLHYELAGPAAVGVNREVAAAYMEAVNQLRTEYKIDSQPDLAAILRLPGVIGTPAASLEEKLAELEGAVTKCLTEALDKLDRMRAARSESPARRNVRAPAKHHAHSRRAPKRWPSALGLLSRAGWKRGLKELLGEAQLDPARLAQEAAIAAERSDVSEEIARLAQPRAAVRIASRRRGDIGKKLDFLLQEMQREANTLLSKTPGNEGEGLEITRLALEIKSEIEKLREQVQNIE